MRKKEQLFRTLTTIGLVTTFTSLLIVLYFLSEIDLSDEAHQQLWIVIIIMVPFAILTSLSNNITEKHTKRREQEENDLLFLQLQSETLERLVKRNPHHCTPSPHWLVIEGRKAFLKGAKAALETSCSKEVIERELESLSKTEK